MYKKMKYIGAITLFLSIFCLKPVDVDTSTVEEEMLFKSAFMKHVLYHLNIYLFTGRISKTQWYMDITPK